ncbi:MAG: peptidase dimerization domain-containing protein [Steroidobacteraceae bacterium]
MVGLIKGGINTNVVPDVVTLRIDRRIIPEESPATVEQELTNGCSNAALPCLAFA